MTTPILHIDNLQKQYEGKAVLEIDHLRVEREKVTAVVGPSGAGKSTLLSIINGIEIPTKGRILFAGNEFSATRNYSLETRRKMVMVFQKPAVFHSSVYENIAYGLKLRKLSTQMVRQRVEEAVELIGLKDKIYQRAYTLSGGEAQRVTLARAMVLQPELLLLDEPTANLDPANVIHMENLILFAKQHYKSTILMVTHNMYQARRLADIAVFMLNGKVIEQGVSEELFKQPRDEKTQAFTEGKMIY